LTRPGSDPILDSVEGVRHLGFLIAAGVLLALPSAAAEPGPLVYSTRVPAASRVEATVAHTVDWDVSVSFDPETCEVVCEYRRKEHGFHLFLPPVTELRIYTDGAVKPSLTSIDPAGTRLPAATPAPIFVTDPETIEGKGVTEIALTAIAAGDVASSTAPNAAGPISPHIRTTNVPLRI
jgi:hypothetical protein